MSAKKTISEYKEKDFELIRKKSISIINNEELLKNATGAKAIVEAMKTLGRLQHLFQVDKEVIRETTKKRQGIVKPALKPAHQKALEDILDG